MRPEWPAHSATSPSGNFCSQTSSTIYSVVGELRGVHNAEYDPPMKLLHFFFSLFLVSYVTALPVLVFDGEIESLPDFHKRSDEPAALDIIKRDNALLTSLFTTLNTSGQGVSLVKGVTTSSVTQGTIINVIVNFLKATNLTEILISADDSGLALDIVKLVLTDYEVLPGLIRIVKGVLGSNSTSSGGFLSSIISGIFGDSSLGSLLSSVTSALFGGSSSSSSSSSGDGIVGTLLSGVLSLFGLDSSSSSSSSTSSSSNSTTSSGSLLSDLLDGLLGDTSSSGTASTSSASKTTTATSTSTSTGGFLSGILDDLFGDDDDSSVSATTTATATGTTTGTSTRASTTSTSGGLLNGILGLLDGDDDETTVTTSATTTATRATASTTATSADLDDILSQISAVAAESTTAAATTTTTAVSAASSAASSDLEDLISSLSKRDLNEVSDIEKRDLFDTIIQQIISIVGTGDVIDEVVQSLQKSGLGISVIQLILTDEDETDFAVNTVNEVISEKAITLSSLWTAVKESNLILSVVSQVLSNGYLLLVFSFLAALFTGKIDLDLF